MSRKLTDIHRGLLRELADRGSYGSLTCALAERCLGRLAPTSRAYSRMRVLGARGLAKRDKSNSERWYITDLGRSALSDTIGEGK